MVGYMVRRSRPEGREALPILAALLTYWAVGLAYAPVLLFKAMADRGREKATAAGFRFDAGVTDRIASARHRRRTA
jgi:hypothetical protein